MYLLIFGLLFLNTFAFSTGKTITVDDYCKEEKERFICKLKCKKACECQESDVHKPFTDKERETILYIHNTYRNDVANGKYQGRNCPTATDMEILSWSKECEFLAGCWAKQCRINSRSESKTVDRKPMGQNVWNSLTSNTTDDKRYEGAFGNWFDETKSFSAGIVDHVNFNNEIRYASQMLWSKTKYVGCAYQVHNYDSDKGTMNTFVVCNYLEAGNIHGSPIYGVGTTASKCPTKNSNFSGLCGEQRSFKDDDYVAPITLSRARKMMTTYIIYVMGLAFVYLIIVV